MVNRLVFLAVLALLTTSRSVWGEVATAAVAWESRSQATREVATSVLPSVVVLEAFRAARDDTATTSTSTASRTRPRSGIGAGLLTTIAGTPCVLTSGHVVSDWTRDEIRLTTVERRIIPITEIRTNHDYDVAVLLLDAKTQTEIDQSRDFARVQIGASRDVAVGDFVLAIGHPFGLRGSLSFGMVSGLGRYQIPVGSLQMPLSGFIQTDAATNPGNSGGPLVNLRGEVIGIVTAIASTTGTHEGVALAMPIDVAISVAEQLVTTGVVWRPFLGLELDPTFDDARRAALGMTHLLGARVQGVATDSPAARGKLQTGDIVIAWNGRAVENDRHLIHLVAIERPDTTVPLRVVRDGNEWTTEVRLGAQESP